MGVFSVRRSLVGVVAELSALAKANHANCQVPPACVLTESKKNSDFERIGTGSGRVGQSKSY